MTPTPAAEARARDTAWLVLRAQAGDRPALEALLERARDALLPFVEVMLRDDDAAADVLQDVLVLLFRRLGSLREPRAFGAWARRIAAREVFHALRRDRRLERVTEPLDDDLPAEEVAAPEPGLVERLPDLLRHVSPASRAVLALHYLDELTLDEISASLEIPVGTVKSRLAYGLTSLRKRIAESSASSIRKDSVSS